jgi:pentose-5-phosphate-3-epimerase
VIPTHVLTDLKPDERVAVLSQGGEIHFRVHLASDKPEAVRARAAQQGAEAIATHLRDHAEILALVASRERDVGGEA